MNLHQLPAVIKQQIPTARLPLNYEAAKVAISECSRIDECMEWGNKAEAVASYAKQIKDDSLMHAAMRIKLRARTRVGELLLEIVAKPGGIPKDRVGFGTSKDPNSRSGVARAAGIPRATAGFCIAMARVPKEDRERLIEQSPPITPSELALRGRIDYGRRNGRFKAGEACKRILSANWQGGFGALTRWMEKNPAAELSQQLSPDEAEYLRPYLLKVLEWTDEFEQRLPRRAPTVGDEHATR